MPSITKTLLAGLAAATVAEAGTSATLTGTMGAAGVGQITATLTATTNAAADNVKGGSSTISIAAETSVEMPASQTFKVKITPAFAAVTKSCAFIKDSPTVSVTVQLTLPTALKAAINAMIKAANGLTGTKGIGITVDQIETPFPIVVPYKDVSSFSLASFAATPANLKAALGLLGADIQIMSNTADMAVYKAGLAVPFTAKLTMLDTAKMVLPLDGLCEDGKPSKICGGKGIGCGVMCAAVKAVAPEAYSEDVDFATEGRKLAADLKGDAKTAALKYFAKCGPKGALTKDCFSVGDTSKGACINPPAPTTTTAAAAAKSGASTTVMSAVVAGASLMMALMM